MGYSIRKCRECGKYSLHEKCPTCGGDTADPKPAKFSPKDPYGKYRRISKRDDMICKAQK